MQRCGAALHKRRGAQSHLLLVQQEKLASVSSFGVSDTSFA
jgi:hypothetical protein